MSGKIAGWPAVLVLVLVLKQILHEGSGRMAKLSVVIITENEEKFIADAANCTSFADEVLELDCVSTDKTPILQKSSVPRSRIRVGWVSGCLKTRRLSLPTMTGCSC